MGKKSRAPSFEYLCAVAERMPLPRTSGEWRAVSSAMRKARRAWTGSPWSMGEIKVEVDGYHRRIMLQKHCCNGKVTVYNGNSPRVFGYYGLIRHAVHMYRQGCTDGRLTDARVFAAHCREAGPVPLP